MQKKYYVILSCVFAILMIYFYSSSLWLYLDNSYLTKYLFKHTTYTNIFSAFDNGTIFGYEQTIHHNARWISNTFQQLVYAIFGGNFASQIFIYCIFFLSIYFFGRKLFLILKLEYLTAPLLLLMFNPITIYLLNQMGHMFSYVAPLMILAGLMEYYSNRPKYIHLLYIGVGANLLFSYPRLTVLYGLLIIIFFFTFLSSLHGLREYFHQNLNHFFKKTIVVLFIVSITNLTLFNDFYYKISASNYTKGALEYMEQYSKINGVIMYNTTKKIPLNDNFIIREITGNIGGKIQNSTFYNVIFFLFLILILYELSNINFKHNKYRSVLLVSISLYLLGFLILSLPKYIDTQAFIALTFYKFPIFVNNLRWMYAVMIFSLIIIVAILLNQKRKRMLLKIISGILSLLCVITVFGNYKLTSIDSGSTKLLKSLVNVENYGTLFYPSTIILTSSGAYSIQTNLFSYKEPISGNTRLVNLKQASLYSLLSTNDVRKNIIFNQKEAIVYKDVRNSFYGEYDYFPIIDYVGESKKAYSGLIHNPDYSLEEENEFYYRFSIRSKNEYDYSLYSPKTLHFEDANHYFQSGELVPHRTQLIDPKSTFGIEDLYNFTVPNENSNIHIEFKKSNINPTFYPVRLSNINPNKDFLLQFNKTYSNGWKLKWITKEYYENFQCDTKMSYFSLTNNEYCILKDENIFLRSMSYFSFMLRKGVQDMHHFEGNFIGNGWLITPDDLYPSDKNQSELYAIIYFEKQFWNITAILVSVMVLIILSILSLLYHRSNKHHKK